MIKIIYFDFGGVLIDYSSVFRKVCSDFNLNFEDYLNFYLSFQDDLSLGKLTTNEFWEKCIEEYNLNDTEKYDFIKWRIFDFKIIRPISDLIYSLENKIDIGIISNIGSGTWETAFKYKMVPNINYKKVYLSYKLKMKKPGSDIYEKIGKESLVGSSEILFVDDQERNLKIPRSMGWKTVLFDMNEAEKGVEEIKAFLK